MRIVGAIYVRNEVEPGWTVLRDDVPLGKRYHVDLDDIAPMVLHDRSTGRETDVDCVFVVGPGRPGYLPLLCFKLDVDA